MEERPKPLPPLWRPFLECPLIVGECSMHIRPVSKRGWNDADDEGQRDRASRKISETKRRERAAARPSVTKEQQRDRASRKSSSETKRRKREQHRDRDCKQPESIRWVHQKQDGGTQGAEASWGSQNQQGGQKRKASRGPDPIDRTENEGRSW